MLVNDTVPLHLLYVEDIHYINLIICLSNFVRTKLI